MKDAVIAGTAFAVGFVGLALVYGYPPLPVLAVGAVLGLVAGAVELMGRRRRLARGEDPAGPTGPPTTPRDLALRAVRRTFLFVVASHVYARLLDRDVVEHLALGLVLGLVTTVVSVVRYRRRSAGPALEAA